MPKETLSRGTAVVAMLGVAVVYMALGFVGGIWAAGPTYAGAIFNRHAPIIFTAQPGVRQGCDREVSP